MRTGGRFFIYNINKTLRYLKSHIFSGMKIRQCDLSITLMKRSYLGLAEKLTFDTKSVNYKQ